MKRLILSAILLGTLTSAVTGQVAIRVVTKARIPSAEAMDRLGLTLGWHAQLPLEGPRDGIATVQVIPRGIGEWMRTELLVQTFAGVVYLYDAETGTLRWSTGVGLPFSQTFPAAYNSNSIIVNRREYFYLLNRDTGVQRVYKKGAVDRLFGVRLDTVPSAAPVADDELLVFPFEDRLLAFSLPDFDRLEIARQRDPSIVEMERTGSVQPIEIWNHFDPTMKLNSTPTLSHFVVGATADRGRVFTLRRTDGKPLYPVRIDGNAATGLGQSGEVLYASSQESATYAIDVDRERVNWRFPQGGPALRRPDINDADAFIRVEGRGLFRVERQRGQTYWLNSDADRFLAVHYLRDAAGKFVQDRQHHVLAKYVYAYDRYGRLLILDGDRGTLMGQYDTSAWTVPIVNEWTDRLYLGNQDGQLMALRARSGRLPQICKSVLAPRKIEAKRAVAPVAIELPEKKEKEMEKEKEKSKDDKTSRLLPPTRPVPVVAICRGCGCRFRVGAREGEAPAVHNSSELSHG